MRAESRESSTRQRQERSLTRRDGRERTAERRTTKSSTRATSASFKVKWKVDPRPGCDSTQMRPPWNSTIFLQMANPMPEPG